MNHNYKLKKDLRDLKKGTILKLVGQWFFAGDMSFEAQSVWENSEYFEKVE